MTMALVGKSLTGAYASACGEIRYQLFVQSCGISLASPMWTMHSDNSMSGQVDVVVSQPVATTYRSVPNGIRPRETNATDLKGPGREKVIPLDR